MRRKSIILSTCLCLMLSLAACSKKADKTDGVQVTLGQYKGIEVKLNTTEVTDEEVKKQVDSFNQEYGTKVKVTDREDVQLGDIVNIDYEGKIDDVAFDGGTATGSALTIGSGQFIDGFEDGLIGKKVGETVDVKTTFPEDYGNPEVAGKEAIFTVKINYIEKVGALTDEVVAENDPYGNKTVAEFEANMRKLMQERKDTQANNQKEIDILMKAIEGAKYENISQDEYDREQKNMREYYNTIALQNGIDLETYVTYAIGLTMEQFEEEIVKQSELYIHQKYLLEKVAKVEKMELTEEEYNQKLTEYMNQFSYSGTTESFVQENGGKEEIKQFMLSEKAKKLIFDTAIVIQ